MKTKWELERFQNHCLQLEALGAEDGVIAYNKLRSIEKRAHKVAEDDCNFGIEESEYEKRMDKIRAEVKKVFGGKLPIGFFINGDPRGYALKIKEEQNRIFVNSDDGKNHDTYAINYRDFGGYGILAPDSFE